MKVEATIQKTEMVNRVMGIKEWSLIVILSILWGGSFFFVGVAVKEMPPLTIVLCRVALASIILLVIVYLKGDKIPSSPGIWGAFIIMGALNNLIPFSLIVWVDIYWPNCNRRSLAKNVQTERRCLILGGLIFF